MNQAQWTVFGLLTAGLVIILGTDGISAIKDAAKAGDLKSLPLPVGKLVSWAVALGFALIVTGFSPKLGITLSAVILGGIVLSHGQELSGLINTLNKAEVSTSQFTIGGGKTA